MDYSLLRLCDIDRFPGAMEANCCEHFGPPNENRRQQFQCTWFLAVFSGIVPQRMKTIFPSRRDDGSLDLLTAFVSRREIRE